MARSFLGLQDTRELLTSHLLPDLTATGPVAIAAGWQLPLPAAHSPPEDTEVKGQARKLKLIVFQNKNNWCFTVNNKSKLKCASVAKLCRVKDVITQQTEIMCRF